MALPPRSFGSNPFASPFDQEQEAPTSSIGDLLLPMLADYETPDVNDDPEPTATPTATTYTPFTLIPHPTVSGKYTLVSGDGKTLGGTYNADGTAFKNQKAPWDDSTGVTPYGGSGDPAIDPTDTKGTSTPETPLSRLQAQIDAANNFAWGTAGQYGSASEGLSNYSNEYEAMVAQVAEHSVLNNAQYYRNPDLQADGRQALNTQAKEAATDRILAYLKQNNIPLSKQIGGQTVYLNLGDTGLQGAAEGIYRNDSGVDYDEKGEFTSYGEIGTYSTVYIPPVSDLDNPWVKVMSAIFPQFGAYSFSYGWSDGGRPSQSFAIMEQWLLISALKLILVI
jgi:hypothetical protein